MTTRFESILDTDRPHARRTHQQARTAACAAVREDRGLQPMGSVKDRLALGDHRGCGAHRQA